MALSDEEITHGQKCLQIWQRFTSLPMVSHHAKFAKAIEKEARKEDEALIKQLWYLVQSQHDYIMALPADVVASLPAMPGFDGEWAEEVKSAARARLEKAP